MKIFLDTSNVDEIREGVELGLVDGVTTNPTLAAKEAGKGKTFVEVIKEILQITPGPVSVEVVATDYENMMKQALKVSQLGSNAVVKIPMTLDGLKAIKTLKEKRIPVNCTLIFNPIQALLAAKSGAEYVSPFVGRLDDTGEDGMQIIDQIKTIFVNYGISTKILVASIRNPVHVLRSAVIGADVVTLPFDVLRKLPSHPKTDEGLKRFLEDWKKVSPEGDFPL
ncbi:MAG: fructose-6-phosphate aldolase [Candidatus Thermoplasmatota archaeon]|nr:fructose-6-phosphate aldolase [Candidatus Thermoplasmatota archaeon]MDA8143421.1 fructose-6-phosphate aldolase [Thermoplasmatales archaeon]